MVINKTEREQVNCRCKTDIINRSSHVLIHKVHHFMRHSMFSLGRPDFLVNLISINKKQLGKVCQITHKLLKEPRLQHPIPSLEGRHMVINPNKLTP